VLLRRRRGCRFIVSRRTSLDNCPLRGFLGQRDRLNFTVDQYERMIELGILTEDAEVELLDGWIVPKMSRNAPHDAALYYTHMALIRRLPAAWICRGQSGMTTDTSQPEPDLTVVLGPAERYEDHHPTAQETALAIEISDSSISRDRGFKGSLYANASIPIYWIIDIVHKRVEAYAEPASIEVESVYRQRRDYGVGENMPLVLAGIEVDTIPVQDLLPRGPMVQPS
jgi:Uma2 family endonuclease